MKAEGQPPSLSAIVCTHRPNVARLLRTLTALSAQTLPQEHWECLLVDNASGPDFPRGPALGAGPASLRIVEEPRLGLSHARRRGCLEARGALLVFVDDDNLLAPDYLARVLDLFSAHETLGCLGGRALPEFETPPPAWSSEFHDLLALRDLGPDPMLSPVAGPGPLKAWPPCAPIGAGLALRREALASWLQASSSDALPDRQGGNLSSSGDNDIVAHILEAGWRAGYFPGLVLTHLMPRERLQVGYLGRLNRGIQESWMRVLSAHGLNPWPALAPWSIPPRKLRAWFRRQAWKGGASWIRWQGDCGHFEGRRIRRVGVPLSRRLGCGRLAYLLYHKPRAWLSQLRREGGLRQRLQTNLGRAKMRTAARRLPPPPPVSKLPPLTPHLLTGTRFWEQTAFCLWTLAQQSGRRLAPVIHDDGSLSARNREDLRRLFPLATFVSQDETRDKLVRLLPRERFPVLRERWDNYPNIRKLIDVHLGCQGWKLVLDSDLLFFRRPSQLLSWLDAPQAPLHAVDCQESYGYSRPLMERLVSSPIPPLVNVGLCGLDSGSLDWEQLERWSAALQAAEGSSYFLEQALVAMLLAGRRCTILPKADYATLPSTAECLAPQAVMHHYVDVSKRWYFTTCWREALRRGNPASP